MSSIRRRAMQRPRLRERDSSTDLACRLQTTRLAYVSALHKGIQAGSHDPCARLGTKLASMMSLARSSMFDRTYHSY